MALLRESIGLRGYAQESPVQAYTKEGYDLFDRLLNTIEQQTTVYLLNAEIRQNIERKKVNKNEKTNESDTTAKKQPKKVNKIGRNEPCPCGGVDKKKVTRGLRGLLDFNGKYITIAEYDAGIATIEFYCFLGSLPSEDMMKKVEFFLHTADISS